MASFLSFTLFTLYFFHFSALFNTINGVFVEEVKEAIVLKQEDKMIHLHFYFHDILGGKNPTAIRIAGPSDSTMMNFGLTRIIDNALTEEADLSSKLVGKAQGIYAIASQSDLALLMVMNLYFVEGKYSGSSISILGRNEVTNDQREMPIIGGNGLFRFARGYVLAHTVSADPSTGDATVEYNVYVQTQSGTTQNGTTQTDIGSFSNGDNSFSCNYTVFHCAFLFFVIYLFS